MLKYVACLCKGCDACSVFCLNVTYGAVVSRVWEVQVFCNEDVVCWCLVYILWQFSMLRSA